ncbi:ethanolaminephosphotransferase 1 [Daphnia magna]|uniref:sn-1,2-diacylglycerol ethanolamine-and cholinephosphotransferase n=1 Tax=Daphnia magna TaxID=35525 RepID=A0A0P6I400_9CRUS|nr:ethanolaminephosphotransferase 1 [Daphnia magna]KAK4036833.1 hypothetical protein OUZ56_028870 [Daphnia magna]
MGFFDIKYLKQEHLNGFDNYKYSAVDNSPLSQWVMHPFWNACVKICPEWVAPNLLTFVGFLFTAGNWVMLGYYDYYYYASSEGHSHIPNWVWLVCAINHFLAHTLDGIDGKQARRTQSSNPLGELFDHGLDSWTSFFIPAVLYSVFGRVEHSISVLRLYFCLINVLFTFLSSHWEKYNTGVLFLPWGYDVSQLCTLIIYLITFTAGYEFWKFTLPGGITAGALFELMMWGGSLLTSLPVSFYNMYRAYRDGTGKNRSFLEGNRPLVSPLLFFTMTTTWVLASPTNILEIDPRCFTFMVGIVFSNICCQLIVAQMSNTRCELFSWLLLPVGAIVAAALMLPSSLHLELPLLYGLTAFTFFAHVHYGVCLVRQMCRHLNIWCFRLKQRKD